MAGLGKTGSGEVVVVEAVIEAADVVNNTKVGKEQLVFELVDAVGFEKDATTGTPYGSRTNPGALKVSWFVDSREFRQARDKANRFFETDEIADLSIFQGTKVRLNVVPRKDSNFVNFTVDNFISKGNNATAEPLSQAEVVAALVGKTPAEAMQLGVTAGIKGTQWAKVVAVKSRVETELGLTVGDDGTYQR